MDSRFTVPFARLFKTTPLCAALAITWALSFVTTTASALPDGVTATGKVKVSRSSGVVEPSFSVTNSNPFSSSVPRVRFKLKNAIMNDRLLESKARTCSAAVPSAFDFPVAAFACPSRSRIATGRFSIKVFMTGSLTNEACGHRTINGTVNVFNHHEPPQARQLVNEFVLENTPVSFNRIYSTNVDNFSTSSTSTVVLDVPKFWTLTVDPDGGNLQTLYEREIASACGFFAPSDIGYSVESIGLKYGARSKTFKRRRAGKKVSIKVDLGDAEHHDPVAEPGL